MHQDDDRLAVYLDMSLLCKPRILYTASQHTAKTTENLDLTTIVSILRPSDDISRPDCLDIHSIPRSASWQTVFVYQ